MIKVAFTQTAEEDYLALLDETSRRSLDEAIELDTKFDTLIENLQKFKYLCPPSRNFPKFRRCVITQFVSLVFHSKSLAKKSCNIEFFEMMVLILLLTKNFDNG